MKTENVTPLCVDDETLDGLDEVLRFEMDEAMAHARENDLPDTLGLLERLRDELRMRIKAARRQSARIAMMRDMLPKDEHGVTTDRGFICGLSTHGRPLEVALCLGAAEGMHSLKYGLDHTVYRTEQAAVAAHKH